MDQKINVTLTADSKNAEKAMERSTESIQNMEAAFDDAASAISDANKNITESTETATDRLSASVKAQSQAMEKASAKAKAATETAQNSVSSFGESLKKYVSNFFSIESMVGLGKKIAGAWWKATGAMADIGKSAKSIGASTEYFQQLKSTSEELGVSFSSIEGAFKTVNEQARKARSGSQEAASAFEKIGISVSRLRQMSPDQVFQAVTSALHSLGDATYAQDVKLQLLGNSAGELTEHMAELSQAKGSMGGLFEDKDIKNAESLKESVDKLHAAIQWFASLPIVTKGIGWIANQLSEAVEEIEYLTGAKKMPEIEGGDLESSQCTV